MLGDASPTGMDVASATREEIRTRKRELEEGSTGLATRPKTAAPKTAAAPARHDVAVPPGYDPPALEARYYGTLKNR